MPKWKKRQPGCPCCTDGVTCALTTFTITKCCGTVAVGATVTVKNGSTVVGTCTTNSSGVCTIDLSAYISVYSLTVTVSYQPTYYQQYTNVLLGSQCGRSYQYTLQPIYSTTGGCGSVTVRTLQCDNATPYGSVPVSLRLTGSGSLVASGTTDATTGVYTFTGITTGTSYTVVGTSGRGELISSAPFTLACNEDVRLRYSATYPPACSSPNYTNTATSGTVTYWNCCSDCDPITVPQSLTLTDPNQPKTGGLNPRSGTPAVACGTQSVVLSITDAVSCYRWSWQGVTYIMACTGSGITLTVVHSVLCGYAIAGNFYGCGTFDPTLNGFGYSQLLGPQLATYAPVTAASVTCSPFAATFNLPSKNLTMYQPNAVGYVLGQPIYTFTACSSYTIPARTITINA